jgi:hypothetical protein
MLVERHLASFRHFGETRVTTGSARACRSKAPGVSPWAGSGHPRPLLSPKNRGPSCSFIPRTPLGLRKTNLAIIKTGSRPAAFTDLGYFRLKRKGITLLLRGVKYLRDHSILMAMAQGLGDACLLER